MLLAPVPLPEHVPHPLASAIAACLHRVPEERPTPRDVATQMEELLAALPKRLVLSGLRPGLR